MERSPNQSMNALYVLSFSMFCHTNIALNGMGEFVENSTVHFLQFVKYEGAKDVAFVSWFDE